MRCKFQQDRIFTVKCNFWNGHQTVSVKCNKMSPYIEGLKVDHTNDHLTIFDTHIDSHIQSLYDLFGISSNTYESSRLSIRNQFTGRVSKGTQIFDNETVIFNCMKINDLIFENKLFIYGFINYELDAVLFVFERQFFDNGKKYSRSRVLLMTPDDNLFAYFIEKTGGYM